MATAPAPRPCNLSDHANNASPSLIGLDWGTTSLRAFLIGMDGTVLNARQSDRGVQRLAGNPENFEHALTTLTADWLQHWPQLGMLACGMVGSAQGWCEAPYVHCPADANALAARLVSCRTTYSKVVWITPGIRFDASNGMPDVMRGEEIQVIGAMHRNRSWPARSTMVLPGTHSKWVEVRSGRIISLRTRMTGELFEVLRQHSILGRLMPPSSQANEASRSAAFARGVEAVATAPHDDLLHQLFSARILGLAGHLAHDLLQDYLSGLLIGSELSAAIQMGSVPADQPLLLIGETTLCKRYAEALVQLHQPPPVTLGNTAPAGLWSIAKAAGITCA